ncbi:uncharacterized protein C8R40DRAFT_1177593 [Lentinula edodes]|uniref:uncharacterized protein n=1 Tax=Lentinula edodes TaxID=5353 RepID=UPI001E8CBE1D|nr:uncharacterized protein C8R40DRAFT_1177593 [Lentinula edodes]KAH7868640.1 hypothetical protein C8R40DRAFT_1177593 [Lentinula edodes]
MHEGHTPPTSHQTDLKKVMRAELGDQTWQFPLDRIARMLSPKKRNAPLDDKVIDHLGNYTCVSDSPGFMKKLKNAVMKLGPRLKDIQWPSGPDERTFYTPLAQFLNACVSVCKEELRDDDRYTKGPFHDLEFIVYDKETQDSVDGASPVKPDLVGGKKFMAFADSDDCKVKSARLYWNPPDKNTSPILLPVEVKDNWIELVCQAATYARCLFSTSPLRQYSLVLGYNHKESTFRFLIFHRGGLSASLPLDLHDEDSHKSLLHVFLSLLSCSHARDAGIAAWCNERQFKLPVDNSDKPDYVVANVDEILHDGNCCRGRANRVMGISYGVPKDVSTSPLPVATTPLFPVTQLRRSARIANAEAKKVEAPVNSKKSSRNQVDSRTRSETKVSNIPDPSTLAITPIAVYGPTRVLEDVKQEPMVLVKPLNPCRDETSHGFIKAAWPKLDLGSGCSSVPEAQMLNVCGDKFGTSQHHYSFPANHSHGIPTSNHIFLPTETELKKGVAEFHWNLFYPRQKHSTPSPEYRSLWIHVGKLIGTSLVSSPSPLVLFTAILHAMLGWLAICQEALQHRDVSVGNVLRLENPVEMPSFKFKSDIADLMGTLSLSETLPFTVTDQITRLKSSLAELKVNTRCSGFIIDGDMAIDWKTYFDANHDGTRSGTPEFMSDRLRRSLRLPRAYVQSTVDDLASFYYVGQWAAVFNPSHQSNLLEELRNDIAGSVTSRESASSRTTNLNPKLFSDRQDYGSFLLCCIPTLAAWKNSITSLDDWFQEAMQELIARSDGKIDPDTHRSLFLSFAYHGVADFAQILERNGASLASYDKLVS